MTLNITVIAWVTLLQSVAYYAVGSWGIGRDGALGVFPQNAQGMVRDALVLADPLVNFAVFDTDNDGYVAAIDIMHSGYAAETLVGGFLIGFWSYRRALFHVPGGKWTSADRNVG